MKIGFIGCGVVGGALVDWFKKNIPEKTYVRYDPGLNLLGKIGGCGVVFVSVPVPTLEDGSQDLSIITESLKLLGNYCQVFIRSTVMPGTCDKLQSQFPHLGVYSMPEFLTERSAQEDMDELPIIIGAGQELQWARNLFRHKKSILLLGSNKSAELVKYTHNCFLAMKVTYFNSIKEICAREGIKYESIRRGLKVTTFVGEDHTLVPGPDGNYGYGGKCFPKDVKAFKAIGEVSEIMSLVDRQNDVFRLKGKKD